MDLGVQVNVITINVCTVRFLAKSCGLRVIPRGSWVGLFGITSWYRRIKTSTRLSPHSVTSRLLLVLLQSTMEANIRELLLKSFRANRTRRSSLERLCPALTAVFDSKSWTSS